MHLKLKILFLFFLVPGITQAQEYSWNNLPEVQQPVFKKDTFNIVQYGAVADGTTLNTQSISKAIDACHKNGGGVVLVPEGLWLTGPIALKSNVNLHLRSAATLFFTADKSQYALVEGFYEGKAAARNQSPVSAKDAMNIAITGKGIIDGNGDAWRAVHKEQLTEGQWKSKVASGGVLSDNGRTWYPSKQFKDAVTGEKSMLLVPGKSVADFADMKDFLRPNLVALNGCKKVLLEGIIFQNSPAWCLHPLLCEDLTIRDVTTKNPAYAHNGDGMDIESCRNFLVENCRLDVGDDAICIKSGKDEEGRRRGKPTENGVIRNNIVYAGHGGFVIGSEMSGGARNIFVENCTFIGTDKGLRFKSVRGRGGVVEHIYARNIFMKDMLQEAIFFDMYYFVKFATDGERDTSPVVNEGTPVFRNMVFENIVCNGAKKGIFIRGLPEMPVRDIRISNAILSAETGVELTDAAGITLDNVQLNASGKGTVINMDNSASISLKRLKYPASAATVIRLKGERTKAIIIERSGLKKGSDKIVTGKEVPANAITIKG